MTGLPGAEPPDLAGLPAGTSVILCPLDGCDWKLVEPPRTAMSLADAAEALRHADPTALTIDEMVSSAVANRLLAEARGRERLLTEHFESHDLLDFLRTIHTLRTQLDAVATVPCPIHEGVRGFLIGFIRQPDFKHPATHDFTYDQVQALLRTLGEDDWEDGPRCLLDVLKSTEDQA